MEKDCYLFLSHKQILQKWTGYLGGSPRIMGKEEQATSAVATLSYDMNHAFSTEGESP